MINEEGITFVIDAGSEMKLLGVDRLGDDEFVEATPAISGDRSVDPDPEQALLHPTVGAFLTASSSRMQCPRCDAAAITAYLQSL